MEFLLELRDLHLFSRSARIFITSKLTGTFRKATASNANMTTPTVLEPFQPRTILRNIRGFCLITPWLLQLLGTNVLLSLLLPVSFVAPSTIYHVSSRLAYWIWKGVQNIFTRWNGARITTSGDELPQNEAAIVISNHVSWTDFYMIQELAIRANMLPYCRWFAKKQLRWVPFLGWGLWAMGMPLVSRQWDKDRQEMQRVFKGPLVHKWPMCKYVASPDRQQLIVAQG
jgi:1-acyl-sn-glycerol-3-phosphate acyltransferase